MLESEYERFMAGPSGGEDSPPPRDPSKELDRDVATKSRPKSKRPPRFKVLLYNDDYTPMEFVVQVLEKVFSKSPSAAKNASGSMTRRTTEQETSPSFHCTPLSPDAIVR